MESHTPSSENYGYFFLDKEHGRPINNEMDTETL